MLQPILPAQALPTRSVRLPAGRAVFVAMGFLPLAIAALGPLPARAAALEDALARFEAERPRTVEALTVDPAAASQPPGTPGSANAAKDAKDGAWRSTMRPLN